MSHRAAEACRARSQGCGRTAGVLLLLLAASYSPVAVSTQPPLRCEGSAAIERILAVGNTVEVELQPGHEAWLWTEELGHDLQLEVDPSADPLRLSVPPRFGVSLLRLVDNTRVRILPVLASSERARIRLGLDCATVPDALIEWLRQADKLSRHFGGGIGSLRGLAPPADLTALIRSAPAPRWRAFALHLRAQWLLLAGDTALAGPAFVETAVAWASVGAAPQAAAARVAAVESLRMAGRIDDALALTRAAPAAPEPGHYFGVRLEAARCGGLFDRGELIEAERCYAWALDAYRALDEPLEASNLAINRADALRRLARHEEARAVVLQAIAGVQGESALPVLGRAEYSLAETAAQQGNLPEVLGRLQAAHARFERAGEVRWRAHVLRRLSTSLLELGRIAEAQLALDAAQSLIAPEHAPLPYASGLLVQGRLLRARGAALFSLVPIEAALATATAAGQRELHNLALLELASSHLELGEPMAARTALGRLLDPSEREYARAEHLRALAAGATAATRASADAGPLPISPFDPESPRGWSTLSLSERVELLRQQARGLAAEGAAAHAERALLGSARALSEARLRSANPLLDQALREQILRLRATAVDLLAQRLRGAPARASTEALETLVQWLSLGLPRVVRGSGSTWGVYDAGIGQLLLGHPGGAQAKALLAALDRSDASAAVASTESLRAALDARVHLQLLLSGEQHALWVDWHSGRVHHIADLPRLRERLTRLGAGTRSLNAPEIDIRAQAQAIADQLQLAQRLEDGAQLELLAEDLALEVEWSVLPGGDGEPLGASHRIRLLQPGAHVEPANAQVRSGTLQLLQAAQWQSAARESDGRGQSALQLPALHAALSESALISKATPRLEVRAHALSDRSALLEALARPGEWLHVSAHGQLQPGLLGGSGLWLDPAEISASPQFMSALDIQRRGARAEHVVLNACQLAATDAPSWALQGSHTSFAQGLVLAGTQHVVAARWPVSDGATQLWVPAYYRALQAQLDAGAVLDPAAALREARASLQRSRAFRHPFHWATWVHIERMPLSVSAPTQSGASPTAMRANEEYR